MSKTPLVRIYEVIGVWDNPDGSTLRICNPNLIAWEDDKSFYIYFLISRRTGINADPKEQDNINYFLILFMAPIELMSLSLS